MGAKFSSWFTTKCDYCNGTGYSPINRSKYCQICEGNKYLSVFRMPRCFYNGREEKYRTDMFENAEIR